MAKPKQQDVCEDKKIRPLTASQDHYFSALYAQVDDETGSDAFVFATGCAGTGKTYVAASIGTELYRDKEYGKIVIIKPTVGPDSMGFLPGDISEKYEPWVATVSEPIQHILGKAVYESAVRNGNIVLQPLEYIRGKTFDNAFIIIDEAQNLTISQVKVAMTRIGKGSKMVFCADDKQVDLPANTESGLIWILDRIHKRNEGGIEIIKFRKSDVVRSGACRKALDIIED